MKQRESVRESLTGRTREKEREIEKEESVWKIVRDC